jgi:hypothetical protein
MGKRSLITSGTRIRDQIKRRSRTTSNQGAFKRAFAASGRNDAEPQTHGRATRDRPKILVRPVHAVEITVSNVAILRKTYVAQKCYADKNGQNTSMHVDASHCCWESLDGL